jgi:hypothetical protein
VGRAVGGGILPVVVVTFLVGAIDRLRLRHLRLRGSDDAIVVLGVLEVILAGDPVAA